MKDIMQRLAELEATAPKAPARKKMITEDSVSPPVNKKPSLKDMFHQLSEAVVPGQKPLPVLDPQNKQAGAGFVTSNNPAVQNMLKNLDPKDVQIVQAPGQQPAATGQQPQATAAGQPNPNQQTGQQAMKEVDMGQAEKGTRKSTSHIKGYKVVDSSGKVISKHKGQRDAIQAALKNDEYSVKVIKDKKLDELSPELMTRYARGRRDQLSNVAQAHDMRTTGQTNPKTSITKDKISGYYDAQAGDIGKARVAVGQQPTDAAGQAKSARMSQDLDSQAAFNAQRKHKALKGHDSLVKTVGKLRDTGAIKEGDLPSSAGVDTKGAGLGAGRSQTTLEGKEPQVEVIDNAFNRENYKDLIGKKYPKSKAPSYARVKEVTESKKGVNPFAKKDDNAKAPVKGKKPDFLDLDKDGNKKEPMKKAAADKKKKKVDESMNHRISAARFEGKAHGLKGHAHCGKSYEDLGEMKAYHEGYKEGLDECYGQGVYETAPAMPAATVPGMASAAMPTMEDDMEEGNAFTAALAKTPKGGKFAVGGKTFTDRTGYDAKVNEYAFESWDNQLNDLLNEGAEVNEGLSVSISKGQQNSPDSVTITAQDAEAEHLLAFVKNAGLGLFGDDNADTHSSAMSVQPSHGAPDEVGAGGIDIGVVDGHDGMMGLMQKLSGIQAGGAEDYADEEGDEEQLYGNHETADKKDCGCDGDCECSDYDQPSNEATCNECGGMMEAGHSCSSEMVDEVESEDQMEFEVAEDNAPDTGEAESTADEDAEAEEDAALATSNQQNKTNTVNEGGDGGEASEEGPESKEGETDEEGETVSESFANLFRKLAFIAEESQAEEDDKAEKAAKKVAKDIEHDEGHKGKDDDKAEKAGEKVKKDIEYDDKKDKKEKVDEWANNAGPGKTVSDTTFEQDIDFMTKVISGGLNKQKSTGQTTIPVIAGQTDRMGVTKEAVNESVSDWVKLAGIK